MERKIRIRAGKIEVTAELNDTRTAQAVWKALPIKGLGERWGDEIYFAIPVSMGPDNAHELAEVGDLAYWPPGAAFCLFFGPTPASRGGEIRPASPVNVFGRITGDAKALKQVKSGSEVIVEKIQS